MRPLSEMLAHLRPLTQAYVSGTRGDTPFTLPSVVHLQAAYCGIPIIARSLEAHILFDFHISGLLLCCDAMIAQRKKVVKAFLKVWRINRNFFCIFVNHA